MVPRHKLRRGLSRPRFSRLGSAGTAAALALSVHLGDISAAAQQAPQAPTVTVASVEARATNLWDEFSGRLEAVSRVEVRPRVAGPILSTSFTEGELVRKGDILFTIDPATYEAEVARAEAQLEAARSRVILGQAEVERAQQLVGRNAVTQRELEQRENALREAVASVKAAEAALQIARLDLGYTQVRSPIDGRVSKIEVTAGNLVAAGPAAQILTTIVSIDPIYASFDASEDIVRRAIKTLASDDGTRGALNRIPVVLTTSDGASETGHVQFIDNQVSGQSGTIRVRAIFPNTKGQLIPGQFARLRMGQPTKASVVLVDERAIGTDQDKRFVLVVDDGGRTAYRGVTLGPVVDGLRVVNSGLNAGERIVVNGLQRVRPGMIVNIELARMGREGG